MLARAIVIEGVSLDRMRRSLEEMAQSMYDQKHGLERLLKGTEAFRDGMTVIQAKVVSSTLNVSEEQALQWVQAVLEKADQHSGEV